MKERSWLVALLSYPVELLVAALCWAVDELFLKWHNRRGKRK